MPSDSKRSRRCRVKPEADALRAPLADAAANAKLPASVRGTGHTKAGPKPTDSDVREVLDAAPDPATRAWVAALLGVSDPDKPAEK